MEERRDQIIMPNPDVSSSHDPNVAHNSLGLHRPCHPSREPLDSSGYRLLIEYNPPEYNPAIKTKYSPQYTRARGHTFAVHAVSAVRSSYSGHRTMGSACASRQRIGRTKRSCLLLMYPILALLYVGASSLAELWESYLGPVCAPKNAVLVAAQQINNAWGSAPANNFPQGPNAWGQGGT